MIRTLPFKRLPLFSLPTLPWRRSLLLFHTRGASPFSCVCDRARYSTKFWISTQSFFSSSSSSVKSLKQSLDDFAFVERLEAETPEKVQSLWLQHHIHKDCISAVIPTETFKKLEERGLKRFCSPLISRCDKAFQSNFVFDSYFFKVHSLLFPSHEKRDLSILFSSSRKGKCWSRCSKNTNRNKSMRQRFSSSNFSLSFKIRRGLS